MRDTTSSSVKPIVFYVPGLYSSTLRQKEGGGGCLTTKQWNPPKSLLSTLLLGNQGHKGLKLPISWHWDEHKGIYVQDKDDIEPDDCLQFVQDNLLKTLSSLDKHGLIEFHKIVWDWRRSFEEAVELVSDKIQLLTSSSSQKAIVVTHSTGALVTWPTIDQHPEWISCWINVAGCLTKGSNMFLSEFFMGWRKHGIQMFHEETFFSFAGLYSYFPLLGQEEFGGVGESDYVRQDGRFCHELDIYKVETWQEYKLGIYGWKNDVTEEERSHLQHSLDAAKRLRESILVKKGGNQHEASFLEHEIACYQHLKIICYGTDKLQTHSAYLLSDDSKLDVSSSKLTAPGDGTLFATNWQTIPGGLPHEIIMAQDGSDHVSLVNDTKLQKVLVESFFDHDPVTKASAFALLKLA